jgi:hypothetical protein
VNKSTLSIHANQGKILHTGARPSAGSITTPKSALARLNKPSITFGSEKYGRSSSYNTEAQYILSQAQRASLP